MPVTTATEHEPRFVALLGKHVNSPEVNATEWLGYYPVCDDDLMIIDVVFADSPESVEGLTFTDAFGGYFHEIEGGRVCLACKAWFSIDIAEGTDEPGERICPNCGEITV